MSVMMKNNKVEIDAAILKKLLGCATYAFVKDGKYLYVGSSNTGIRRALSNGHLAATTAIAQGADLIVIPCRDRSEALRNERRMLEEHMPIFNRTLERPKLPVLDTHAAHCLNKKCLHRWTIRTEKPQRCPKCGRRLELQK